MKVIISVKNGTKNIEIIKIKDEMIKNGIEPVFKKEGAEVFSYDDFVKWWLLRNYYTEKSIEVIKRKWEQVSEGYNFVIGIVGKDTTYFYGVDKYNKMLSDIEMSKIEADKQLISHINFKELPKARLNVDIKGIETIYDNKPCTFKPAITYCENCGRVKEDLLASKCNTCYIKGALNNER